MVTMTCSCDCAATASHFDRRRAQRDRSRYERHGPDPTTTLLLEELRPVTHPGDTLLDVGGGIGVLGLELLRADLREAVLVEAAPHYLAVAQDLIAQAAQPSRFRAISGNFTQITPPLAAEIVTLDRVVCCYPDFATLLGTAAASARRVLALSFPKDRWYVRLMIAVENLLRQVTGNLFRAFVHRPSAMAAVLSGAGWRRLGQRSTLAWSVERWGRTDA
ncbi:MAG: methyltransferase [Acidobacteria bacterium]|nr:methyltransferase [Acidobacteriota bacterium]